MRQLLGLLSILVLIGCNGNNGLTPMSANIGQGGKEAKLKVDTKGHRSKIQDIIVTKSGDIISASTDKTIRVWNSITGKEKQKILGEIGEGGVGQIYAIALSPNEKFLAVGGRLAEMENRDTASAIRIYNYQTGELIKNLISHTLPIDDLSFSSDGKFLISASKDYTAKIWNMNRLSLSDTIRFHKDNVLAVKIFRKGDKYFAITAGYDNQIALYDMQTKEIVKSHKLKYKLSYLATNGQDIAVCGVAKEITIYNTDLEFQKTISSETIPTGLAYSPNGNYLLGGAGAFSANVNIYTVNQNYQKTQSFTKHKDLTRAVAFLDNQTVVSGGGVNNEIYIWDINSGKEKLLIKGIGERIGSVGIREYEIVFTIAGKHLQNKTFSAINKSINLNNFSFSPMKKNYFKKISKTFKNYSLEVITDGEFNLNATLLIKKDGKVKTKITRTSGYGFMHSCYGFYKNYIISGGMDGFLVIYDLDGRQIASLVGHTNAITSIAVDGDRLVSASKDQTIRIWDLNKAKIEDKVFKINEAQVSEYLNTSHFSKKEIFNMAKTDNYLYNRVYLAPKIYPQLNLFITKEDDWIAWTPQGFYNASKRAEKYIGYHINQGANKEAEFLDISRFKKQFYRPDIITEAVEGKDISHYAKGIDIDSLLKAGLPPQISIQTSSKSINKNSLEIGVKVCEKDGGIDNLTFYIDNKPMPYMTQRKFVARQKQLTKSCSYIEEKISVPFGTHIISVDATNKEGNIISNTSSITVTNTTVAKKKPNLHILTLTVTDYKDDKLDLTYPNNDADGMIAKLKEIGEARVFGHVYAYPLKDSDVNIEKIDETVKKIASKVEIDDVFVLYLSGHGKNNSADGDYYFIPYDFPHDGDVRNGAINQKKFREILRQVEAVNSILLIDTCESGKMASEDLLETTIKRFSKNVGSAIIAGTANKQSAIDGYKKHGIFTYTLLAAMNNKKNYNFQDEISISNIATYVKVILPKLSKETFHYEQKPTIYFNGDTTFAIGGLK